MPKIWMKICGNVRDITKRTDSVRVVVRRSDDVVLRFDGVLVRSSRFCIQGVHASRDSAVITTPSEALESFVILPFNLSNELTGFWPRSVSTPPRELDSRLLIPRPRRCATLNMEWTLHNRPTKIAGIIVAGMNNKPFNSQKISCIGINKNEKVMVVKLAKANQPSNPACAIVITL
jgi:hypothetical protein